MHDIDAQISRITGQDNYMETLQKITGNIMTVDMDMFHACHKKISACDFNIKVLLSRLVDSNKENQSIKDIFTEYDNESTSLDIKNKTFSIKQRKGAKSQKPPREIISPGYLPSDMIKTKWFKSVKHIEKNVNKYLTAIFPENLEADKRTFEYLNDNVYKNNPEVKELQSVYDIHVNDAETLKSLTQLHKCTNTIINLLMDPMYDVKSTIRKHWGKIEQIFKSKAFQQSGIASSEDIIDMLHQFIIAKYRATITGKNKHYAKLFLSVVGNENVSQLDGARFIEIMDSIDLDKLDKKENVYKFATNAKNIIHSIVNNENINAMEVIEQLNKSFDIHDEDEDSVSDKPEEPVADGDKYMDLL